jgi:hypothetical protein
MEDNEVVVTIPCNDHAIFVDKFGILYERIGFAWKKDKDNLERLNTPYYIAEDGQWNIPAGVKSPLSGAPVIAHRGDTIPFENLHYLFGYTEGDISDIIPELESYDVRVDKSNMTGSLNIFMDHLFPDYYAENCSSYELTVETDTKVIVMSLSKNLHFTNLGLEDKDEDILGTLEDHLVSFLIEYCKQMGLKVEFGIFFRKSASSDADQRKEENRIICQEERKYLGPIRKFVKEKFEKDWNDVLGKENERELYKKERDEWQQEAASKYDKDPNLME